MRDVKTLRLKYRKKAEEKPPKNPPVVEPEELEESEDFTPDPSYKTPQTPKLSDEDTFRQAMEQDPGDETNYEVFADYLEEQGDPRSSLVRSVLDMERERSSLGEVTSSKQTRKLISMLDNLEKTTGYSGYSLLRSMRDLFPQKYIEALEPFVVSRQVMDIENSLSELSGESEELDWSTARHYPREHQSGDIDKLFSFGNYNLDLDEMTPDYAMDRATDAREVADGIAMQLFTNEDGEVEDVDGEVEDVGDPWRVMRGAPSWVRNILPSRYSWSEAVEYLRDIADEYESAAGALYGLITRQQQAESLANQAVADVREGNWMEALRDIDEAVEIDEQIYGKSYRWSQLQELIQQAAEDSGYNEED